MGINDFSFYTMHSGYSVKAKNTKIDKIILLSSWYDTSMPFRCYLCGRCCTALGQHIAIQSREGNVFHCTSSMTGESFTGHLTENGKEVFDDTSIFTEFPQACPFLRQGISDKIYICTIFDTMPSHCRSFECYTMLIRDTQGEVVGKVRQKRSLSTGDEHLRNLFNSRIVPIQTKNEVLWQKEAKKILNEAGYKVKI